MEANRKPLGIKSYGSIAHLPGSRMGPGDHKCHEGQKRIATEKMRDRHDHIIVQEKLDGSNVGVARLNGDLYPLTRAGYLAQTSPYEQHWHFAEWVERNRNRFLSVLSEGERLCGEWLMQAHGTRYELRHEPFVAFDLMVGNKRAVYDELMSRVSVADFITPTVIHKGSPLSVEEAMSRLGAYGFHGALDPVEGGVWRVERNELIHPGKGSERRRVVDYLIKYVRPDKVDGCFLPDVSGKEAIWNWQPR
ncbi:MAG: RNA ligase family protein [Acidobacteriota bacterium]